MDPRDNRIKLPDLQDRKVYRLLARNIKIGVWNADYQEFLGIRTKFGHRYIDSENHWDAPAFATACPMEVIAELPMEIAMHSEFEPECNQDLFHWLEAKEKELGLETPPDQDKRE